MVQGAHHQNSVVSPLKISAIPDTQYCSTEKNLLLLSNDLYCIAIYMYCDLWCSGGNRNVTTLHPPPPFGGGSKRAGVIWSSPHHRTLVPHLFHVYLPYMAVATLYCSYSRSLQATSYDEMGTYIHGVVSPLLCTAPSANSLYFQSQWIRTGLWFTSHGASHTQQRDY